MSISSNGSAESRSSGYAGVTGARAERRTPGIQRIAPSASQTTGRPHRSSRGTFRSIRISFTFFPPSRAFPPASRPNGRIRSPARNGRTVSGNVRPAASNTSASPFAARRSRLCRGALPLRFPGNVTIRLSDPTQFYTPREWNHGRGRSCFPRRPFSRISGPFRFPRSEDRLFVPVGQFPPLPRIHACGGAAADDVPVHRLEQPFVRRDPEPIEADPLEDLHPQDGRERGERISSEDEAARVVLGGLLFMVPATRSHGAHPPGRIFTFRRIHRPASASR